MVFIRFLRRFLLYCCQNYRSWVFFPSFSLYILIKDTAEEEQICCWMEEYEFHLGAGLVLELWDFAIKGKLKVIGDIFYFRLFKIG